MEINRVTDDAFGRAAAQRFARELSLNLWRKHLAVPQGSMLDFMKSLPLWFDHSAQAMIFDNSALEDSPLLGAKPILRDQSLANKLWREVIDPDADAVNRP